MLMTPRTPRAVVRQQTAGNRNRPPPRFQVIASPEPTTEPTRTTTTTRISLFASPEEPRRSLPSPDNDSVITLGDSPPSSPDILVMSPPPRRPATAPLDRFPLATSTPARPVSALPTFGVTPRRQPVSQRITVRPLTLAQTPRCARPTKAWMARCAEPKEPPVEQRAQKRCSKEVWERLTGGARTSDAAL